MQPGMMAVRQSLEASGSFLVNAGYAISFARPKNCWGIRYRHAQKRILRNGFRSGGFASAFQSTSIKKKGVLRLLSRTLAALNPRT